ncbi:MAG: VIT1/CCC1 family protein [Candidatus ainarchaeum sp.]|nr:VIT1/CCC1 family protein [Candidatus ainarchaeum sp.]
MKDLRALLGMEKGELTEHKIYSYLAEKIKDPGNSKILASIASDELRHYGMLKAITGKPAAPDAFAISWYTFISTTLGLSFGLKLMENGERNAQSAYGELEIDYPALAAMIADEERHEHELISMLSEERLEYASSIILGLNDALVELSGTLAGLTLALANSRLIALSGLIMGVAAALSMAASSYLSAREDGSKDAKKASVYTGITYIFTVLLLIAPYFIFQNVYAALAVLLAITILVIAAYTFYITTAKGQRFRPRFAEMAAISLAVAFISFIFGLVLKYVMGA